ncbi:MAG TPA: DUF2065 family protein [Rhizobiaceae bacterium]|nr:DUF2065 family protein [Rhizobiaceae bacterium]
MPGAHDFWTAFGLVLVFEGLIYGGFPALARRVAMDVLRLPEHVLRFVGTGAIALGVLIVWLARSALAG